MKKIKLEIACNDDFVKPMIQTVIKGARTGEIGDGKMFAFDLLEVIRIRTGEKGGKAIG